MLSVEGWVFPKAAFQRAMGIASISAALAAGPVTTSAIDFSGSYSDPFHPNCQRVVTVKGLDARISGTDGNPGCPPDGSGRAWKLQGKVDNNKILVDFSPKGGPKDLVGVWDEEGSAGILWPDGNKWTVKATK